MQHKTHTDQPSKNKDQQNQNQGTGNQRTTNDNNGRDKNGTQRQDNKPGGANGNQQGPNQKDNK